MRPDKTEQAKSTCTTDLCQNGGVCFEMRGFARCNCTGTKFTGRTCEKNKAQVDREKAERQEVQGALAKMEQLKKEWKDKTDKCSAKDKRHVCPRDVGPKADQCVASMTDCWVDGLGKFNSTLMNQYRQKMKGIKDACNRTQGEKYCFKEETCVGRGLPCTPQQECPDDKPFRCGRSWKCQENKTMCDNDDARPGSCKEGEQKCPDGECYLGTGLKECVKQGVQWDGCPAGKMRCKSDKRRCAASVAECQDKTGCPSGMQMCGVKRDTETGKALFDTTTRKLQVRCMANCTLALERKPKDKKQALNSATGGQLTAETEDGKKAMRMKIRPKNFKGGDRAVNFTIKAVPDSLMQEGAFKTFHESGSLMGSLIQIEPSEYVEIEGGIELDIPILDPEAQTDPALCAAMLDDLQMVAVSDITDVDASLDSFGTCSKGELDGCSCAVNITHFSTYTVIDGSIAYEAPAEPAQDSPDQTGASTVGSTGGSQKPYTHQVDLGVKLPLSKAEFSAEKQDLFKKAVGEAAGNGVTASDVSLANIADARRSGSVKFDVTVKTTSESLATAVAGGLTATKLNEKLAANGLPDATITKPPTVSGVDSALSAGGAAGVLAAKWGLVPLTAMLAALLAAGNEF